MKRVLVVAALIAISAIYFFQSNDQEKVKIGSSASPEKLTQRDYQGPPKKIQRVGANARFARVAIIHGNLKLYPTPSDNSRTKLQRALRAAVSLLSLNHIV